MRRAVALLALGLAAAACGGDGDSKGSAPTTPGATTPEVPGRLKLTSGSVRVEVGGSATASATLPLSATDTQYFPPPGGFSLVFKEANSIVSIGGGSFEGTQKTSDTLVVGIVINQGGKVVGITSTGGECAVTFTKTGTGGLEGSFDCKNVKAGADTYTAKGAFAAS